MRGERLSLKTKVAWLIVTAIFSAGFFWSFYQAGIQKIQIVFLDVGQGDAALLLTESGQTILVDGGPNNALLNRLGEQLPYFSRRLDYVIISHFHDDHISGLVAVLERYDVGEIIFSQPLDSAASRELAAWLQRQSVSVRQIKKEAVLNFSPTCRLHLISPAMLVSDYDENDSLITHFVCGSLKALLSGDNRQAVEQSLVRRFPDLKADIFKAGHHGSKTANSQELLEKIKPQLMVISVGADNRFGHPHQEIIERAQDLGIEIRRTDRQGSIVISPPK